MIDRSGVLVEDVLACAAHEVSAYFTSSVFGEFLLTYLSWLKFIKIIVRSAIN